MSTTPIQAPNSLQQLAQLLLGNFDANKDGQLSLDEFLLDPRPDEQQRPGSPVAIAKTATTPVYSAGVDVSRRRAVSTASVRPRSPTPTTGPQVHLRPRGDAVRSLVGEG